MHLQENTACNLDHCVKFKRAFAQYSLQHVTSATSKLEAVTSNNLGGDTFTRKTSFDL